MPKTLMPYPRLFYGFSLILQLITYLYSSIFDSCILCELQVERAVFESILEQRVEVHKAGRNVMTSQRRDVGSMIIEVNKWQRCDISVIFASPSLKAKRGPEIRASKNVRTRARKAEQQRPRSTKKRPTFLFSPFCDKTADAL